MAGEGTTGGTLAGSNGMVIGTAIGGAILAILAAFGIVMVFNQTPSSNNDSSVVQYGTTTQ